ncbi:hypothetical protein EXIGLDRAFT_600562, partial [Exidia glandulosa HHB12029]
MVFAGDFAQLPPVNKKRLYDTTIGLKGRTTSQQHDAIGKTAWHQVTRVVLLRQNMRQRHTSAEDDRLRQVLTNMRYKECTNSDIDFLHTLVVEHSSKDNALADWKFRHASVITGLNAHRDTINMLGCEKFARDMNEQLSIFHSVDSIGEGDDDYSAQKTPGRKRWITNIKQSTREMLWNLPHISSDNIPGILKICKGMPVIIKKNHATECGVTNGGEGVVIDWIDRPILDGKRALDVLFIRLTNGNLEVNIDGLPPNVVPICAESVNIECELPDDSHLTIKRQQV